MLWFNQLNICLTDEESNNDINYSIGFGLPVKISKKITLNCDYALDPGLMNEGISQLFSITLVNY